MRKLFVLMVLATALVAAVTPESSAFFRRRRCPPPCPPCPCPTPCPPVAFAPAPFVPLPPAVPATVTIRNKVYQIVDTGERGDFEHDVVRPPSPGEAPCPDDGETFCGTARRKAKTSIAEANLEPPFDNLGALLNSLPADPAMRALNIPHGATSGRVAQENRNVKVKAWIYAYKKEDDRDYHLILGTTPNQPAAQRRYMNVEISGLPIAPGAVRNTLKQVRTDFKEIMQEHFHTNQSYKRFQPPVPVEVTGSLFFDVSHTPPAVGPTGLKPRTAWEIHPVTKIDALDD